MERSVGEVFQSSRNTLKVVINNGCEGCFFEDVICNGNPKEAGICTDRSDGNSVIFKKL